MNYGWNGTIGWAAVKDHAIHICDINHGPVRASVEEADSDTKEFNLLSREPTWKTMWVAKDGLLSSKEEKARGK